MKFAKFRNKPCSGFSFTEIAEAVQHQCLAQTNRTAAEAYIARAAAHYFTELSICVFNRSRMNCLANANSHAQGF